MSRQWTAASTGGRRTTVTFENFRGMDGYGYVPGPVPAVPRGFLPRIHTNTSDPTYGRVVLGTRYNYTSLLGLHGFCEKCCIADNFNDSCSGEMLCHQVYYPSQKVEFPIGFRMVSGLTTGRTWLPLHYGDYRDCVVAACYGMDELSQDRSHLHVVHRCKDFIDFCRCNGFDNFRPYGFSFVRTYQSARDGDGRSVIEYLSSRGRQVLEVVSTYDTNHNWSTAMGPFPEHEGCFVNEEGAPAGVDERPLTLREEDGWPTVCDFPSGGVM